MDTCLHYFLVHLSSIGTFAVWILIAKYFQDAHPKGINIHLWINDHKYVTVKYQNSTANPIYQETKGIQTFSVYFSSKSSGAMNSGVPDATQSQWALTFTLGPSVAKWREEVNSM